MENLINIEKLLSVGDYSVYCSDFTKKFIQRDKDLFYQEIEFFLDLDEIKGSEYTRRSLKINGDYFLFVNSIKNKSCFIFSNQLGQELFLLKNFNYKFAGDGGELFLQIIGEDDEKNRSEIHSIIKKHNLENPFVSDKFHLIDESLDRKKKELVSMMNSYRPGLFEKVSDIMLTLSAHYALIRIHLLKFLAILPSLEHDQEGESVRKSFLESISRLLKDYEENVTKDKAESQIKQQSSTHKLLPKSLYYVFKLTKILVTPLPPRFLAWSLRAATSYMAQRFIAGKDIASSYQTINQITESGRSCTLDQLGELVVSSSEAKRYYNLVCENIKGLGDQFKGEKNKAGIYLAHVSVKVTALCHDIRPHDTEYCYRQIAPLLKNILLLAKKEKVFVHIDAEHYKVRDLVFQIYSKILLETNELTNYAQTGIVIQAYLRDACDHFMEVLELNQQRNTCMPIRLVKGAYWDAETIYTEAHQHLSFQFLNKVETDAMFRLLINESLDKGQFFQLCLASHNYHDHLFALELREQHYPNSPVIEHQCLHMTYESLSLSLVKLGHPVRNYLPIGDLIVGMGYLVRRIMENSSQVGILNISRSHKDLSRFESCFEIISKNESNLVQQNKISLYDRFIPQSPYPLYGKKSVEFLENSFNQHYQSINKEWDLNYYQDVEGIFFSVDDLLKSRDQSNIHKAFNLHQLIFHLQKFSQLLLFHRLKLASMIVHEAKKNIEEALADVDEGIDFVNFYVRSGEIYKGNNFQALPNIVIAPWNFPLAIPLGMSIGSLLAGRETILKPSELTPKISCEVVKIAREAGLSSDYLKLFIGGKEEGAKLTSQIDFDSILFTGSRAVGVELYRKFTHQINAEGRFKRVIAELGGKNAIVVTDNCELDETIAGVLQSCFGHAGQKCSACSRVFVDQSIYQKFKTRLVEAVSELQVGKANDFSTFMNPVIDEANIKRIKDIVKQIQKMGQADPSFEILIDRTEEDYLDCSAISPFVYRAGEETLTNQESYAFKEIFGPVIMISTFKSLEEAVGLVNSVEYALTGGIFTQSDDDSEFLIKNLEAGNLYVNRSCTGARVGIEPFGGFKMSGTGPKAGSFAYISELNNSLKNSNSDLDQNNLQIEQKNIETKTNDIFNREDSTDLEILSWLRSSLLSFSNRKNRMQSLVKLILSNSIKIFDLSIVAPHELDQEVAGVFSGFTEEYCFDNYKIPGQKSYNSYQLGNNYALVVINETHPNLDLICFILMSLMAGNPLLLINASGSPNVENLTQYIRKSGFSYYNFLELEVSEDDFKLISKRIEFNRVFFQLPQSQESYLREVLLSSHSFSTGLPKFYNKYSPFHAKDWYQEKAIAINTVRHGASIDLD